MFPSFYNKKMRIFFLFLILCFHFNVLKAQTILYPKLFQPYSGVGPLMNYFSDSNTTVTFTKMLDSVLRKKRNWALPENTTLQLAAFNTTPNNSLASKYPSLNLLFFEFSVKDFKKTTKLRNETRDIEDSILFKDVLSVLRLMVQIQTENKDLFFENTVDVYIKQGINNGIGIPAANLFFTKKGIAETLKKITPLLFDSTNNIGAIELTVSRPFLGDNFILHKTIGLPRIQVTSDRGISKFKYNQYSQLIRWTDKLYEEILLKGKNKTVIPSSLMKAFEKSLGNLNSNNEFIVRDNQGNTTGYQLKPPSPVFLIQEGRDIVANKNYQLKIAAILASDPIGYLNDKPNLEEMNGPNAFRYASSQPKINFIPGSFDFLLNDSDTVAVFKIETNKIDSAKKLLPFLISNGVDSNSILTIDDIQEELVLKYNYFVSGKLKQQDFEIKISGDNYFREFYINNKLICMACGNKKPEKFVLFDDYLSFEILNALFILGFNDYFQ